MRSPRLLNYTKLPKLLQQRDFLQSARRRPEHLQQCVGRLLHQLILPGALIR
jgi:hypothetical protein